MLAIHYRGSWGGPGDFSFQHCREDARAAIDWMRETAADSRIDPCRMIVIGHSMGGFIAVDLLGERPDLLGGVTISAVDLGRYFGMADREDGASEIDEAVGVDAGLHILAGASPRALAAEARANAERWRLSNYAVSLADRPLLMMTSNDGFADGSVALSDAVRQAQESRLTQSHLTTDHSYSGCRIELQTAILHWLATVAASS